MTPALLDHAHRRRIVAVLPTLATVAVLAAACTSGSTPSAVASAITNASIPPVATEAPTTAPSEEPSSASTEAPSESELPSAVATDIDPCQLITQAEASALVGVTFAPGKAATSSNHVRNCVYAAPGPNLFTIEVAVAPDEATAKAAEASTEKDLQDRGKQMADLGLKVTELPGFAPNTDAALLEGSVTDPVAMDARALLLLRGTVFVGFSDIAVGGKAPSQDAMKAQANTVLGRLP
jgi:hypothetical protein